MGSTLIVAPAGSHLHFVENGRDYYFGSVIKYAFPFWHGFFSGPIFGLEGNEDCNQHNEKDQHSNNEDNNDEYAFDVKYLVRHFEILMVLK
jgi:hypothetical protein